MLNKEDLELVIESLIDQNEDNAKVSFRSYLKNKMQDITESLKETEEVEIKE